MRVCFFLVYYKLKASEKFTPFASRLHLKRIKNNELSMSLLLIKSMSIKFKCPLLIKV